MEGLAECIDCVCECVCVYLELGFKFIQFCRWIGFTHFLGDKSEIADISLSVSTCQDLQNGIMDEHTLFLYSSEIAQHFVSCRVRNNRPLRNRLVYNWCVVAQWEVLTELCVFSLTRLSTIFILCVLRWMMTPAISTTFSSCSWSRTQSMAIRVPVLPTPALCGHSVAERYVQVTLISKLAHPYTYKQLYYTCSALPLVPLMVCGVS